MALLKVCIHEFWYGETEARGKDTWLWVKLAPNFLPWTKPKAILPAHEWKLVIRGLTLPILGPAVVMTARTSYAPENTPLKGKHRPKSGVPEIVAKVSYDPQGEYGAWTGLAEGSWPVKVEKVKRKTAWERI